MKTSRMSSGDVCHGSVSRVVVEIQSTADTAVAHSRSSRSERRSAQRPTATARRDDTQHGRTSRQ